MTTALNDPEPLRDIPECMKALRELDVPKCFVSYMPEVHAAEAINQEIRASDYDRYVVISDDTVPTQEALDAVLALHDEHPEACVTGYCQLAADTPLTNLTTNELPPPPPLVSSYAFLSQEEIDEYDSDTIETTFAGLAFTCMTRELWLQFPLEVRSLGGQMDYVLSYNLAQAGIPILATRRGYVWHVKERWNQFDEDPKKKLLLGQRPPKVSWTDDGGKQKRPVLDTTIPKHVQAAKGTRIIALLSFYDEPVRVLTGCLSRMALAGIDHVVAVDGRYRLYPGEQAHSPHDQHGAIIFACAQLGMSLSLHMPADPYNNGEVEKRTHMFTLALGDAEVGDWFFVIDADELIQQAPGNLRERLVRSEYDVAVSTMRDMTAAQLKRYDEFPEWFYRRSLFRAQPIIVAGNHHTYQSPIDGRVFWDAKPEQMQTVEALDLRGGRFNDDGSAREPTDPDSELIVQHWAGARGQDRVLAKSQYYTAREEERVERGPCAQCARDGVDRQAARRVTVKWVRVKGMEKPISDIEELCDEHATRCDEMNRRRLKHWGMLCDCKSDSRKKRVHSGVCLDCHKPVDLGGIRVTERNGRPQIA